MTNDSNTITLRDGKAVMVSHETNEYLSLQRELETQDRQMLYQWSRQGPTEEYDGFPGYLSIKDEDRMNGLPRDEQFPVEHHMEETWLNQFNKARKCEYKATCNYISSIIY